MVDGDKHNVVQIDDEHVRKEDAARAHIDAVLLAHVDVVLLVLTLVHVDLVMRVLIGVVLLLENHCRCRTHTTRIDANK